MEERRVHRRTQVQRHIEIRTLGEPSGRSKWMQAAGPTTAATTVSTTAPGRMIDIGCGGMRALVDQTLDIGVPCAVRIHGIEGKAQETREEW